MLMSNNSTPINNNNPLFDLPPVLNAMQLAAALGISRAGAYNLLNTADFPTLHVGARKLVARSKLFEWIDRHSNNGGGPAYAQ